MLRPSALLMLLCLAATVVGAKLYVDRSLRAPSSKSSALGPDEATQDYIIALEEELDRLRSDNDALRQIVEKDAPFALAPELIEFVTDSIELDFKHPPIAFIKNKDALRDAAGQAWLSAFGEHQLEMLSYSFDVLGILPPDQQWVGQAIVAETSGSRGIYDPSTKEIILAEDFDLENIHHQAAIVRLLAIALLDQHYPAVSDTSFDRFLARRALHHGRASILQDRFYTLQAKHIGFITERAPNAEAAKIFSELSLFVRNFLTFPNTHGKDFLNSLPSKSEVQQALGSNSISTQTILLQQLSVADESQPLTSPNSSNLNTQVGALTLKSYAQQAELPSEQLTLLLKSYRTDHLNISTVDNNRAVTRWKIEFGDASLASQFASLTESISQKNNSQAELAAKELSVSLTVTESFQGE